MNIHLVYAHPSVGSLNASLRDEMLRKLDALGHTTTVSDLYAMKWKAVADHDDLGPTESPDFITASREAHDAGTLSADIRAEQEKLLAADTVIMQFPLWWFSMPAIMKGWVDRVLVNGFGYGTSCGWKRYGDGALAGKRGLLVTTAGAREAALSDRGVNGPIEDLLFPLNHGMFFYTGMDALPPVVITGAVRLNADGYSKAVETLHHRLETLDETQPIAYRRQAGGDYDDDLRLKPGLERPGATGFALHES